MIAVGFLLLLASFKFPSICKLYLYFQLISLALIHTHPVDHGDWYPLVVFLGNSITYGCLSYSLVFPLVATVI